MFWLEEAGLPMTGREHRPRDAALAAHRPRDDRPADRRRLRRAARADKSLDFTETGREHASHIVRRHRMIERFLTDVLGIPWDEVHEEAERIEHAMSPVLEERMRAAIGDATTCPHGHPIVEGARERGRPAGRRRRRRRRPPSCASRTRPRSCSITSKRPAWSPGLRARSRAPTKTSVTIVLRRRRATASRAASPRPSRSGPTPRRRRGPRSPSSSSSQRPLRPLRRRFEAGGLRRASRRGPAPAPGRCRATPSRIRSAGTRREGEAQAVLAALDHEVGAGDEGDALALGLGQQRRRVRPGRGRAR